MLAQSPDITPTTRFHVCCKPCKEAKTKRAGRCPGLAGDRVTCFGGGCRVTTLNTHTHLVGPLLLPDMEDSFLQAMRREVPAL